MTMLTTLKSYRRELAIAVLIPFTALTIHAVMEMGLSGILHHATANAAGWQIFIDLVIACLLLMVWMINDAARNGRNPWPFVIITVLAGSFGPLLYLATSRSGK